MARGRRRSRRNRDTSPGARQRPRPSARSSAARDGWKRPLIGALVAVPVGLGVAAGLVLASVPQGHGPARAGSDTGSAFPDDGLPPAVSDDDFFEGENGKQGADSAPSGGAGGQREAAATAEGEVEASESPKDDDGGGSDPSSDGGSSGSAGSSRGSGSSGSSGGSGGGGGTSTPGGSSSSSPSGGSSVPTSEVVSLVNDERAAAGCGPLRVDDQLTTASQKHSEDMAARDYMSHQTPEGKGPRDRAQEAGYTAWSGENVAAGYPSAQAVMDGWMNSEGHRENILNCDFKAIGVGEADGRWTQNFGWK